MYDPKFEKAVRQRMEELQFHPGESVWANIEKAIVPRRERRVVLFWRFLLPGILVTAAASMYAFYHFSGTMVHAVKPAITGPHGIDRFPGSSRTAPSRSIKTAVTPTAPIAVDIHVVSPLTRTTAGQSGLAAGRHLNNENTSATGSIGLPAESNDLQAASTTATRETWFYTPGLVDQRFSQHIRASDLPARKGTVSLTSLSPVPHPWEAGFVAGGGLSRLNRLNTANANALVSSYATSFYYLNSSMGKLAVSDIRADASFDGGIYLQKTLSRRWVFNTGLNLHYYSTRIYVGRQVNAYAQPPNNLLNLTVSTANANAPSYSAGNSQTYTNRYFFLELPVGMQWKIIQSRMLPVFLDGGFSLSRLMSANALFYDPQTGVYSKNGSIVNKTQFNLRSALMVGLPLRGIHIQAGPEVEYGLTPLVKSQDLGDQHLFYAGLRVVILPGRK